MNFSPSMCVLSPLPPWRALPSRDSLETMGEAIGRPGAIGYGVSHESWQQSRSMTMDSVFGKRNSDD